MEVSRLDAAGFDAAAGGFLGAREAEHNLMLGLLGRLLDEPLLYGEEPPYFAVVEDGGRVVGAALRTPPHVLILSESEDASAYAALARDARDAFPLLPGLSGPPAGIRAFLSAWGGGARLAMSQRIYEASGVIAPRPVGGRMRPFADEDRALVIAWLEGFMREAVADGRAEDAAGFVERNALDPDGGLVLWEDGAPVSVAGFGQATPRGIRIGPVYTPPELRGRGYASALVAALTQLLLDGGRELCFLFTDLANETANSIYPRVGYRPVADFERWTFDAAPPR